MSDHDDSAERTPAGGVPEWHRPIEYNEGLEDDDDEGVPEDLPDQRPQPNLFWFKDFNDKFETFDFNTAVAFRGKYPPHHDKILYNIPDDRWVLGSLDYLPGTATPPGVLPTTEDEDIEVSREFATFFITKNDHILPDRLGELADPRYPLRDHPFHYARIRQFYDACAARSEGRASPPIATDAVTPPKSPAAGAAKPPAAPVAKKTTDKASAKTPSKGSFRCYELYYEYNWDQARIAKEMDLSQGTVSKKIKEVEEYHEAMGWGEKAPHSLNKKTKRPATFSVDPREMDKHPKRDGGGN